MKRLVLFVSIFGVGLLILVFALGPSRLWRHVATSTIEPQDLPAAPNAIPMSSKGQRISFGMRGAGTIPFWSTLAERDGASLRVKAAQLKYGDNEPYAGGIHLQKPELELYPAKAVDEKALARVSAAGGDLETQGDLRSLAENLKQQQLKKLSLFPDVRIFWLDGEGKPGLTIETSQLDIPETPPAPEPAAGAEEDKPPPFPKLVAPNPVHIFTADGGFNLNAASLVLERLDGRLELRGPLTLTATHFALPVGSNAVAKNDAAKPDDALSKRPPVTLTCDGQATFTRRPPEKGAAQKDATQKSKERDPSQVIGPGTLVFERNVVVRQTDPTTKDERRLTTDWLKLELENDANGQLTVKSCDAGSADGDVTFGLLGGEGGARHLSRDGDELVMTGPVHLDHARIGREPEVRVFSLRADERLLVHEEAATGDGPPRWRAELFGKAHAETRDGKAARDAPPELDADADHLTAVLLKIGDDAAANGAGAGSASSASSASFDVDHLDLDGHARLDLHGRGQASADRITLGAGGRGVRTAHLEGNAVAVTDRGTLRGPTLDLVLPESKELPVHVTAPILTDARMVLPAGASLFETTGADRAKATAAGEKPAPPRELRLEPVGAARLEVVGEELHLRGRTKVRVFELESGGEEHETQHVTADTLDLIPQKVAPGQKSGPPQLVADGDVEAYDPSRKLDLHAAHAHTEIVDGHRHLQVEGTPAQATIAVPLPHGPAGATADVTLTSYHLDFDLESQRIVADDREHQVTAWIPESLLGTMLPSGFGVLERTAAVAALPPVVFHADHIDVTPRKPDELPKTATPPKLPVALAATAASENPFMHALVNARGHVHAARESDGSTFDAETMVLDLALSRARLDGEPGAPVKLLRPKPYAKDRVEQIVSDWIEATDGGAKVTLAPRRDEPVIVLFPEKEPQDGKLPKRTRVELRCSDPPVLQGNRLLLSGGVDTLLENGDAHDPEGMQTARSHSERVEIFLSGPLGDPNLTLVRLNAQERVHLDYGDYHAEGARLTYEFATGKLTLKQGVEPGRLLAADATGDRNAVATFEIMYIDLPQGDANAANPATAGRPRMSLLAHEFPKVNFKSFRLVAEGPRER